MAVGNTEAMLSRRYIAVRHRLRGKACLPTNNLKAIMANLPPATARAGLRGSSLTDGQVSAVQRVLDKYVMPWADMVKENGPRQVEARAVVVALMRDWGLSYATIGGLLGGRKHCTIVLSHQRHGSAARANPVYLYAKTCV